MNSETLLSNRVMAATALNNRAKEKTDKSDPEEFEMEMEMEVDRIFYWILTNFSKNIESLYFFRGNLELNIAVNSRSLIIGNYYKPTAMLDYFYCKTREDFFSAIEMTVYVFNSIRGYSASFEIDELDQTKGRLKVTMII